MSTGIEWTDDTWNPVVGCSKVSPGCDNCYAIPQAHRIQLMQARLDKPSVYDGTTTADGSDWSGLVRCLPERLEIPLRWSRPRRVFVNSMSDLFHPDVPMDFIDAVFAVMAAAPQHQFQILTKRPQRMALMLNQAIWQQIYPSPLPNVWLGTSIESDRYAFRADHLRATPAAVRFLSLEPLLGPLPSLKLEGIDWVIVGGESGPRSRPMHPDWVRDLRDRCVEAGVPFFFKQWGEWSWTYGGIPARSWSMVLNYGDGNHPCKMWKVGKHNAGRVLDGRTWDEYPTVAVPT